MGATLSQPLIPNPLLSSSIKPKSPKRPRFRFQLRIRWKRKRTSSLPEILALFPKSTGHEEHQEHRESKLYGSSSTEGTEDEEKFFLLNSWTFISAASSTGLPVFVSPVAEKSPEAGGISSLEGEVPDVNGTSSPSSWARHPNHSFILKEKPLPNPPPPPKIVCPADRSPPRQQTQTDTLTSSKIPATTEVVTQATADITAVENANQEHEHDDDGDDDDDDGEIEREHDDGSYPDSDIITPEPERQRLHTPPPWDTSLTGYGSVLEISRPFRARRVFEHSLVEGHFLANRGGCFFGGDSGGGGPLAAEEKRRMWRVWESTANVEGKEKGKKGLKSQGKERETRKEKSRKTRKKTNTKRMSEWRRWKPLPSYPGCTDVAQRVDTWAVTSDNSGTWIKVVEEAKDEEYQGGDEGEEDADEEVVEEEEEEDIEEAIKRFLEMKIPVDMESLYQLGANLAETEDDTVTIDRASNKTLEGKASDEGERESITEVTGGGGGELSPLVASLFFSDSDIEGFEFLVKEEDEGGGISDLKMVVGIESRGVNDEVEIAKLEMTKDQNGESLGGGTSGTRRDLERNFRRKEKRGFSATQRLSRWKELRVDEERVTSSRKKVD